MVRYAHKLVPLHLRLNEDSRFESESERGYMANLAPHSSSILALFFCFVMLGSEIAASPAVLFRPLEETWFAHLTDDCPLKYQDETAFAAMDRLCETCHDMYRVYDPNLRAKCRYVGISVCICIFG